MDTKTNIEHLYTPNEYNVLVWKYNQIFNFFRHRFYPELEFKFWVNRHDVIFDVRRWIVNGKNAIFWDYLWATHWSLEWMDSIHSEANCRCVEFILSSWKTLILSTNTSPNQTPSWIICLDEYYMKFNEQERMVFDRLLIDINKFEYNHFQWKSYKEALLRLKESSSLLDVLNVSHE